VRNVQKVNKGLLSRVLAIRQRKFSGPGGDNSVTPLVQHISIPLNVLENSKPLRSMFFQSASFLLNPDFISRFSRFILSNFGDVAIIPIMDVWYSNGLRGCCLKLMGLPDRLTTIKGKTIAILYDDSEIAI
jgi:hypothetical protein